VGCGVVVTRGGTKPRRARKVWGGGEGASQGVGGEGGLAEGQSGAVTWTPNGKSWKAYESARLKDSARKKKI